MAYARATRETSKTGLRLSSHWGPASTTLSGHALSHGPISSTTLYTTLYNSSTVYSSTAVLSLQPLHHPLRHTHVRLRQTHGQTPAFQPRTTHMSRRVAHNANYPHTQLSRSAKTMNHCPCRRRLVPHSNRCHAPDKSCQERVRKGKRRLTYAL